jgi:hypothetical protein
LRNELNGPDKHLLNLSGQGSGGNMNLLQDEGDFTIDNPEAMVLEEEDEDYDDDPEILEEIDNRQEEIIE